MRKIRGQEQALGNEFTWNRGIADLELGGFNVTGIERFIKMQLLKFMEEKREYIY